ncbi:hypothetical protein B0H10DRAFT_19594 [Mycena sp. CBHHK59/15]|nr:hypothetical protein B0H10DRAFT_19594 [Mycena sp. CBHHK59/15]
MFLDGDSSDITTMHTVDWVITDCDPTLEDAQQVRVFCTKDFTSSSCSDLTKGHTLDTIVKLPPTCSKGNYVRLTQFSVAQNQNLSDAHGALKPTDELVYDFSFDFALDAIDATLLSDEVVFRVDTSNMPGYWNDVVNSAPTRAVGITKRELQERWWGSFSTWLEKVTTIDIPIVKRLDVAGPKSFNYPLFNKQISCPALHLTASATVGVSGQVSIPIVYGVIIMGRLLPSPSISESYAFIDASATASATFYAQGQAQITYTSEIVNIFKQAVYGFSYSNIVSIGPTLILDAYINGQLTLAGNFAAGLTFNSPSYHFAVPDDSTNGNSGPSDAAMGSNVVPSLSASASASGSISIHIVPRAQIGIEIGWQGSKAISALASVSMDTSVTFGFNAQASTSGSSACLYADAGLHLFGGLSGNVSVYSASQWISQLDGC